MEEYRLVFYFAIFIILAVCGLLVFTIIRYWGKEEIKTENDDKPAYIKLKIFIAISIIPTILIIGIFLGGGLHYLVEVINRGYDQSIKDFLIHEFNESKEEEEKEHNDNDDDDKDIVVAMDKEKDDAEDRKKVPKTVKIKGSVNEGKKLYRSRGCAACHRLEGEILIGPNWNNLFGQERKFIDGTSAIADEKYLRESIVDPNKKIVEGYALVPMNQFQLTDQEVNHLIIYIRSLVTGEKDRNNDNDDKKTTQKKSLSTMIEDGKKLYRSKGCAACHRLEGEVLIGPNWNNLFRQERKFTDGASAIADEKYLRESIVDPNKKIVEGFTVEMPKFEVSDEEVDSLVEYIKSLK